VPEAAEAGGVAEGRVVAEAAATRGRQDAGEGIEGMVKDNRPPTRCPKGTDRGRNRTRQAGEGEGKERQRRKEQEENKKAKEGESAWWQAGM